MHLFKNIAVQKNWPSRITQLLELPLERQQQFSNYMCITCSSKIDCLEGDVKAIRTMARCSYDRVTCRKQKITKWHVYHECSASLRACICVIVSYEYIEA